VPGLCLLQLDFSHVLEHAWMDQFPGGCSGQRVLERRFLLIGSTASVSSIAFSVSAYGQP
jgi:hypothetical protein